MCWKSGLPRRQGKGRLLVAVTGASNLTGGLTPIDEIARITHRHGGLIFVDAAQLAGHRAISMRGSRRRRPSRLSGLSGPQDVRAFRRRRAPGRRPAALRNAARRDRRWHGRIRHRASNSTWPPEPFRRENSGTPNAVGIVAMAVAGQVLKHKIGFRGHRSGTSRTCWTPRGSGLPRIDGLRVLGELDYSAKRKCAIVSFVLEDIRTPCWPRG